LTSPKIILTGILILVCMSLFMFCQNDGKSKKFEATWESLTSHQVPEWLLDAKFGIYAHWGVYSVPAYATEWYPKRMYDMDNDVYRHHVNVYGDPENFGYKEFIPMFKAEDFDPDEWADLIEVCGAKYAGIAVVHHDGFCLWNSNHTRWNAANMGPKRDIYRDLVSALRKKEDMKVIATFHHIRTFNWYLPFQGNYEQPLDLAKKNQYLEKKWDIFDPKYGDLYWNSEVGRDRADFIKEWNNKVREVINNYQPDMIWFDGGSFQDQQSSKMVKELLSYYYNQGRKWQKPVEVLNKLPTTKKFNFPEEFGVLTFEEGRDRGPVVNRPWIDDMKISDQAWCYIEGQTYKSANEIIDGLVDRVSRGGGLLLNLSPKADGTIPEKQKDILREIGKWLKTNGDAIYGTRPWKIQAEGPEEKFFEGTQHKKWVFRDRCDSGDIRFTIKENSLYAIALDWPSNQKLIINSLKSDIKLSTVGIKSIILLGTSSKINWERNDTGLVLSLPENKSENYAHVFKIELEGEIL
jgi:alpha-L-fucosidase